eukprot:gb/GECG01006960.1/.p1 GENE.gb/GECG01006960.1/~~gb/GECG01006960.1/.p1  ORF type:complete len:977 (+),score=104.37 gb/GECG01006960.1/:1-2931(+)
MGSLSYKFSNLCGSVYKCGNVTFTPQGDTLLSPVGNRISVFQLTDHTSYTLPCENRTNIAKIAISPNGRLVLSIDEDGRALAINLKRRVVVHRFNFKHRVQDVKFSPDGKKIAIAIGKKVQIWKTPAMRREFAPFQLLRTFAGHYDNVEVVNWSPSGAYIITGSQDLSARIYKIAHSKNYIPVTLSGHRESVLGAFFGEHNLVYTVSHDGAVFSWKWEEKPELSAEAAMEEFGDELEAEDESEDSGDTNNDTSSDEESAESDESSSRDSESENKTSRVKGAPPARPQDALRGKREAPAPDASEVSEQTKEAVAMLSAKRRKTDSTTEEQEVLLNIARGTWSLKDKHYFNMDHARVISVDFHQNKGLLVVGFSSGVFGIYTTPDIEPIHTLSISQRQINTSTINCTGDWLAFGSAELGQLLVWEWQTETYILKQQGHDQDLNCVAYSPDGQVIATGGDDGKLKLWNTHSGFCFVTFTDHTAPIVAVEFMGRKGGRGHAVVSASLDGTVRAFDLVRYRNFRTLTTPEPVQFLSLAVDKSGEVVCAGALEPYEIYVWDLQTGNLLDVLAGHEGPVSSLTFSTVSSLLASGSWDNTVKLWDIYEARGPDTKQDGTTGGKGKGAMTESFDHSSDVLSVTFRPDGEQLCSSSRDGQLHFWNVKEGRAEGIINGKWDAAGGRRQDEARTAKNSSEGKHFSSIAYTADGKCILAGGRSRFVCLYAADARLLICKFQISHNRSLDGIVDKLRSDQLGEHGGSMQTLERQQNLNNKSRDAALPGVKRGDAAERRAPPELRTKDLAISPTGHSWAGASTEGLIIYSIDDTTSFEPFELDETVTPKTIRKVIKKGECSKALVMALHLNEHAYIIEAINSVPMSMLSTVASAIPSVFLYRVLQALSEIISKSSYLEYHIRWALTVLQIHGSTFRNRLQYFSGPLRLLQKAISLHKDRLAGIVDSNKYTLDFLCHSFQTHESKTDSERDE